MGRDPNKTVLVEMGTLRPFSDIGGRHLLRIDNSSQQRHQLALRLKDAGCPVKLDGTDWHAAGDFDAALKAMQAPRASIAVDTPRLAPEARSLLRLAAHRDAKAVSESIREREDQAFINAVTDFGDA